MDWDVASEMRKGVQDGPETAITAQGGTGGQAFAVGSARTLTPAEVIERFGTAIDPKDYGVRVVPAPDWVHVGKDTSPDAIEPTGDSEKAK